jgi:hypothetical protein
MPSRATYSRITIIERKEVAVFAEGEEGEKEGVGMSWLDDMIRRESSRVRDEDEERDEARQRKEDIASQGASLWGSLKNWMQQGAERINKTAILRERVGSDLVYRELSITSFEVRKSGYPMLILTATRNGLSFKLNWKAYQSEIMVSDGVRGEDERLTLDLDKDDDLFVEAKEGKTLYQKAVAEYLLSRFLSND